MNPRTLLVVDDDIAVRTVIRLALEDEGYRVLEAADGYAGLAVLRATPVDLVLLDLNMAGMDGWTLHHRLRADGFACPVIIMTVAGAAQKAARQLGAAGYLAKP